MGSINNSAKVFCSLFLSLLFPKLFAQPNQAAPEATGLSHSVSIGATSVWPDSLKFSLTGKGYTIGQWEFGNAAYPDTSNAFLNGRVFFPDGYSGSSGHATEVASIMIGGGTDPASKGLAYEAEIRAFNYVGRWAEIMSEMAAGMKLSYQAYASNYGWNKQAQTPYWYGLEEVDSTEDYNFGRYTWRDAQWDSLVFQHPYSLVVRAAGNWRGESVSGKHYFYRALIDSLTGGSNYVLDSSTTTREADGGTDGYDCLPPEVLAKNVLTVGAVDTLWGWSDTTDVTVRPGSAFGPVDDGRIKPDVVTAGDKTSQAGAAATGAAVLLQEHYVETRGYFPRASTVKGLLIHTADEAGEHPGPDYKHGWGLVNLAKAVQHISDTTRRHYTYESRLQTGDTARYHFYAEGGELKATICWTDPQGNPVPFTNSPAILDNPKPMLVNDLELRIRQRASDTILRPYVLDPNDPARAAARGENSVDNVEQVDEDEVEQGWYTVEVYHKGSLGAGGQDFSLLISGGRTGLVWDGVSWSPFPPGPNTSEYDLLIMRGTTAQVPGGSRVRDVVIERKARLEIQ